MVSRVSSHASATPPNLPPARKSGQRVVFVSDGLLIRRLLHAGRSREVMKKSTLSPEEKTGHAARANADAESFHYISSQ